MRVTKNPHTWVFCYSVEALKKEIVASAGACPLLFIHAFGIVKEIMLSGIGLQINLWVVFASLGGYQLYLQWTLRDGLRFREGVVKNIQMLVGLPALIFLTAYLFDPDEPVFIFFHIQYALSLVGFLLFNAAAVVILWAHLTLGKFWSGDLETKPNHRVIDTGPYRFVRHPLYSSYLFMTVGLFLVTGNWLVGSAMLLYFLSVAARSWKEEEMMLQRLGEPYEQYMDRTNRFFFMKFKW